MASRTKGITIEINGDVTKLDESLKGVNKSLGEASRGLQDVNRLLKLDPSNTELLSQKQDYLKRSIEGTKEKLDREKEALEQLKLLTASTRAPSRRKPWKDRLSPTKRH